MIPPGQPQSKIALIVAWFIASQSINTMVSADTAVNMENFTHGSELSAADAGIRRIELQPAVITGIQRQDLLDIRVYDANNTPMPSVLLKKDGKIKTSSRRLNISAQYNRSNVSAYVIDRGNDTAGAIDSLQLKWHRGRAPKILTFRIEHSADKTSWQILVDKTGVINLDFKGTWIEQNEVDVNKSTQRYLRLAPLDGKVFPSLAAVTATLASKPHTDYWWQPVGQLEADSARPGHYQFNITTGARPVQFKLSMPLNSLMSGALYSYEGPGIKSRKLFTRDFAAYALSVNRNVINARPVDIRRSSARRWEIAATRSANIVPENLPSVMAAYPRYQLFFASDGDEPYTLVWGNRDANTSQRGDLVERLRAGKLRLSAIREVTTGVFLDNDDLVAQVASRNRLWLYVTGIFIVGVMGIAAYTGLKRYRAAH